MLLGGTQQLYSSNHSNIDGEVISGIGISRVVDEMINSLTRVTEASTCKAAASYYFSVVQYVNVHYGTSHSGIGILEELRWSETDGKTAGHQGESDIHIQHVLAEANNGNAEALTFIAKKYYWGSSGLTRNVTLSRKYFEKASELGDAEGMYNMGIFYESGQGGLGINITKAIEYYKQAANATKPYQKAIHSLGLYYLTNLIDRNYTLAKTYFIQAAKLNSEEAHYELGQMYLNGHGSDVDVPRATAHLAVAASMGHFKAINSLSLALYDTTSWLSKYGRSNRQRYRKQVMVDILTRSHQRKEMKEINNTTVGCDLCKNASHHDLCGNASHYEKEGSRVDDYCKNNNTSQSGCYNHVDAVNSREQDNNDSCYRTMTTDTCGTSDHPSNVSIPMDGPTHDISSVSDSFDDSNIITVSNHTYYIVVPKEANSGSSDQSCIMNGTCSNHHVSIGISATSYNDDNDDDDDVDDVIIDGIRSTTSRAIDSNHHSTSSNKSSSSTSSNTTTLNDTTTTTATATAAINITYSISTNETDLLLESSPYFTGFHFIRVYLPDGSIAPLPFPLGSTDGACESALLLLKHLAGMSYRTKDVSRRAIDEYIRHDYSSSIALLEEASNLGVKSAQENAAYLYEKMMKDHSSCSRTSSQQYSPSDNIYKYCNDPYDCCMQMMRYASTRQWKKLVQSGEPLAMRKLADSLIHRNNWRAQDNNDDNHSDDDDDNNSDDVDAKMLYILAASRGDTPSLMQLGWMLFSGRHGQYFILIVVTVVIIVIEIESLCSCRQYSLSLSSSNFIVIILSSSSSLQSLLPLLLLLSSLPSSPPSSSIIKTLILLLRCTP